MSYRAVAAHRSMALDRVRNRAYATALQNVVRPDSVVLDVGAGTGVLGLLAARFGARRVYLVEPEDVLEISAEIAAANGLQNVVRCIPGRIEDVVLPEPVSLIVSALTGNFLHAEDLLPTLIAARRRALAPGGVMIPDAADMAAVPIHAPAAHAREIEDWSIPQDGIDLSAARAYAANTVYFRTPGLRRAIWLAKPARFGALDLTTTETADVHAAVTYAITRSGLCHGWLGWFRMRLGAAWLSTSPRAPKLHWWPAYLPIDPPLMLERGQEVQFMLDRVAFGDWTWRVDTRGEVRHHSTLLSRPITPASLVRGSTDTASYPSIA